MPNIQQISSKSPIGTAEILYHPVHKYISKWKSCCPQLTLIHTIIDECLLMAMFTESYEKRLISSSGVDISASFTNNISLGPCYR